MAPPGCLHTPLFARTHMRIPSPLVRSTLSTPAKKRGWKAMNLENASYPGTPELERFGMIYDRVSFFFNLLKSPNMLIEHEGLGGG